MDMTRFTPPPMQVTLVAVGPQTPFVVPKGIGAIVVQGRDGTVTVAWRDGYIAAGNFTTIPQVGTGKPFSRGFINNLDRTIYFGPGTGSVVEIELWS